MLYRLELHKLFKREFDQLEGLDRLESELQAAPCTEQPIIASKIDMLMEQIAQSNRKIRDHKVTHLQSVQN